MKRIELNGIWTIMEAGTDLEVPAEIPGSVYSAYLNAGLMEDPYYRDNELKALKMMEKDYLFKRRFTLDKEIMDGGKLLLHAEGLDTVCRIFINAAEAGRADNMHRIWEFDISAMVKEGENKISILFLSPTRWIRDAAGRDEIGGSYHAMHGFPHMRKAHCMFGWDWGPRLPDAGIWRNICILAVDSSRILNFSIRQKHYEDGHVELEVSVEQSGGADVEITVTDPDGHKNGIACEKPYRIDAPRLWWPNGYGEQPLYTVEARLFEHGAAVDCSVKRIGLRTLSVKREKDEWGESFAQCVNKTAYFAMGADYIPEDNLLSRITPERTRKLLKRCADANFNTIRVWGGGYYPEDYFYDICDELGLVVWQDFMFACANYHLTGAFAANIRAEFIDNVKRLRHHASLGLWCGNNEMEMFQAQGEYGGTAKTRSDYIRMFEHIIPEVLEQYDPDTCYWPASPSSGGGFDEPNAPDRGDVHYWDVWHGEKPFTEYRKFFFRYVSEFGFQSFPCMKTIESFTLPEERNIFSRVMEMHQRNEGANGKIMKYLSQTFLYPKDLESLVYASQILQAEAIRYGVEHWRRNRGRCMGAVYWQLNDIWPVASWSSIDYYGRLKALHYYAKRFFAPVLLSCEETGETTNRISVVTEPSAIETSVRFSISNETIKPVQAAVLWQLRENTGRVMETGAFEIDVPALESRWHSKMEFTGIDFLCQYVSYQLILDGRQYSEGTVLFTAPKHFRFLQPELKWRLEGGKLVISSDCYVKSVEIQAEGGDCVFSDNYFDLNGGEKTVEILEGRPDTFRLRSVYDIR